MKHITEARQFKREWLEKEFFPLVRDMEKIVREEGSDLLEGKRMISFFYEPSTRTRCSFEAAMTLLSGKVVFSTENARQFSSVSKGETLEDTIKILNGYHPNVIVLRSDEEGMAQRAAEVSRVPIINAGDGGGEHPTQALLDIYTIQKEFGKIDGISIAMVGDLSQGRTVHSLSYLLSKFSGIKIYFVSPASLKIRDEVKDYLKKQNIFFSEGTDLRKVAPLVDAIYQTRVQKERGSSIVGTEGFYIVNQEILNLIKKESIIMHPLPRVDEISPEVDRDPRAAYFRQAENGLYVRMALLQMLLS